MAGIFTRKSIAQIMTDENLTPEERTDQIFSLYGRALDDGYVTKNAAQAAQEAAVEAARAQAEKDRPKPVNVAESDEYKALQGEFAAYKAMQTARMSDDFKGVKGKFFETVYNMIDRKDGAKPIQDQLAGIKKDYEEYFDAPADDGGRKPAFGAPLEGAMPKGDESAQTAFEKAWGFVPQKKG